MLSRHGWPDSTETHFMALKSMEIALFTSATSHLNFAHERCLMSSKHEGTPAWTKAKPSSSRRSHLKAYRPVKIWIYIACVELVFFVGKDRVPQKFSWSTAVSPSDSRHSDAVLLPTKKLARALSSPGVGAAAILATKITWWHGNTDYDDCSRFKL